VLGVIPLPGLTETKAPEVDPRLRGAVERVLDSTQALMAKVVAVGGEGARSREDFRAATSRIDAARTALDAGDPGGALQSAQEAETALGEVLKAVEAEAAKKAAEAAAAEAAARAKSEETERAKATVAAKANGCSDGMVEIPAGTFRFGSPADDLLRDISEQPQESRKVGAFCIDRWEYPGSKGALPKVKVSRAEAQSLCAKAGKRLCSELEWERACKGPDSSVYPYGKAWNADRCNTEDAAGNDRKVAKTGSFPKCRGSFGVEDMSGNVMEWTSSAMEQNASLAIAKGGSFSRPDYAVRCAFRYTTPPDTRDNEIGFRCCAELP
jgi:formylglycine-generating enzyme required for sulfatase activity